VELSGRKWVRRVRFIGEVSHTIDSKGRIVIPARFRDGFTDHLVVTKGFEGCLNIYTMQQYDKITDNLDKLPSTKKDAREYVRLFASKSLACEIDVQNRIKLSSTLIKEAKIEKQCVFIGAINHIELWSQESWDKWYQDHNDSYEDVAESVTELML